MRMLLCVATVLSAGSAANASDYRRVAACVYKALDVQSPGNFHIATLPDEVVITFETSGGGMTFRDLKATFFKDGSIEVDGRPPGYYPQQVRPLAARCAAG